MVFIPTEVVCHYLESITAYKLETLPCYIIRYKLLANVSPKYDRIVSANK